MKIALLTDLHFGAREGNVIILEHQRKFFENIFFPYIISNDINHLIILGDTFDKRKHTNNFVIDQVKNFFFDRLEELCVSVHIIVGNHDTSFKHTLFPNTVDSLLREYQNIKRINTPTTIDISGFKICTIPWICENNNSACFTEMSTSKADICMGHFEISGFKMYKTTESLEGLDRKLFDRYDMVLSGHYHHRSTQDNITYLGTSYEMTWQDYGDSKGFHTLDLSTRELFFVRNPYQLFVKIDYVEAKPIDPTIVNGSIVKVIVINKTDHYLFETYIQSLYNHGAHDVKIIEDIGDYSGNSVDVATKLEDTQSLLNQYVDSSTTDIDKNKIKQYMQSLYTEALNLEIT